MSSVYYVHLTDDGAIFAVRADGSQAWLSLGQLRNELRAVADDGGRLFFSRADPPDAPAPIVDALVEKLVEQPLPVQMVPDPHPSVSEPLAEGATMLMAFALRGRIGLVDDLLLRGAEVDRRDDTGATALMYAANAGHEPVVQALIDRGAQVDARDDQGSVALMFAAQSGHERVIERLLSAGADPAIRGDHGFTALGFARENGHEEAVAVLQRVGAPD